jgi:GT2 family glycosyltransferase
MSAPDLSILIVNWNCGAYLADCLQSLFDKVRDVTYEVLVVDNASKDDSVAAAKARNLPVSWHCLDENLGFGRANNYAAERAKGRYLLLLNPDTLFRADSLTPMVRYADSHPEIGLIGCQHSNADGTWQSNIHTAISPWNDLRLALFPKSYLASLPKESPSEPVDVGCLAGSCLMMPISLYQEIGLFDPAFFLNDEDFDLAERVRKMGRRVVYHPAWGLVHFGGVRKAHRPAHYHDHFNSRLIYHRKHDGWLKCLIFFGCFGVLWLRRKLGMLRARMTGKTAG